MSEILGELSQFWQYSFVRYAFIVGILVSLCAALLGVTLVLKNFSYIGDGLSHVAFGAMAVASVLNITRQAYLVMPATIICAVILLRSGQNRKMKGDATIALVSVSSLAVGYLLMNVFTTSSNVSGDVCSTLFGSTSIITLKSNDVMLCVILSVIVVLFFVLFYHKIFDVTFDENFAKASGVNAELYNLLIAIIIAIIIVLGMNLVGSMLISALIIFPALSAMRIFRSFRKVTICAAIISVCCAFAGMIISLIAGTPVGATIVVSDLLVFIVCVAISSFIRE